jgi:hypothetical protein
MRESLSIALQCFMVSGDLCSTDSKQVQNIGLHELSYSSFCYFMVLRITLFMEC